MKTQSVERKSVDVGPKTLTESEIQQKLYGAYRSHSRKTFQVPTSSPEEAYPKDPWKAEVERLRAEMDALRKERDELMGRIRQMASVKPSLPSLPLTVSIPKNRWGPGQAQFSRMRRLGMWVGVLLLAGSLLGYLTAQKLQAVPVLPGSDSTPYTIQVAVYDVRSKAQEAVEFLRNLRYEAFLVEVPRRDGRIRYRIYVGEFVTKEEAQMEWLRLSNDPRFREFKDAFVRFR
jgi:hypothetical protein